MVRVSVLVICLLTAGCGYASPGGGEVSVLVRKPFFFGHGGVDPTPVQTGTQLIAASTEEIRVNMTPRTFVLHFDDMFTSDGVPLVFNVGVRMQVLDPVLLVAKYGTFEPPNGPPIWFTNNFAKPVETLIRQAVRKHGLNETALNPTATDAIDVEVKAGIEALITETGVPVALRGFTVGRAAPPDAVKHQRIETAAQQQRKLTEDQRKLAEDARFAAEQSRARADNAYRIDIGLSPAQFVELETVHMQETVCMKGGCTFISAGVTPTLPVK